MNEDELRRMLHEETGPDHDRDGWAGAAVRVGRRRRAVRRAAGAGTAVALVVAAVVGAQALPRTLTVPVQPASPSVTASPAPTPTGADPAPPPTTSPEPTETAVVAGGHLGDAAVYTVVRGSTTPVLQRELDPPVEGSAYVHDLALAAGEDPLACVVWALSPDADGPRGGERELSCYAPGSSEPVQVVGPGVLRTDSVALRPDGTAIAWSEDAPQGNGRVQVADLDGVRTGTVRTWTADPSKPPGDEEEASFTGLSVVDLAFAGDTDRLLVSVLAQSDDGSGIGEVDTSAPGSSWGPVGRLRHPDEGSLVHDRYTGVASATATTAVAVLSSYAYREEPAPGDLGVLVSLDDGTVMETLVTPFDGRRVVAVAVGSGGALAYTTDSLDEGDDRAGRRHYVRWAGEDSGTQLDGPVTDWSIVRIAP